MCRSAKAMLDKSREIDTGLGQYVERLSRLMWPWRETWLLVVVGSLFVFDYVSTYAVLELSGKTDVYESGRLASWALERGGFPFLFLVDVVAASVFSIAALVSRYLYTKKGFRGYGRAAFVFLLMPYVVMAVFAIVNNIIVLLR